jgi:hypothetical protein
MSSAAGNSGAGEGGENRDATIYSGRKKGGFKDKTGQERTAARSSEWKKSWEDEQNAIVNDVIKNNGVVCVICQEVLFDGYYRSYCGHPFHSACLPCYNNDPNPWCSNCRLGAGEAVFDKKLIQQVKDSVIAGHAAIAKASESLRPRQAKKLWATLKKTEKANQQAAAQGLSAREHVGNLAAAVPPAEEVSAAFADIRAQIDTEYRSQLEGPQSIGRRLQFFRQHRHLVWASELWTEFIVQAFPEHLRQLRELWPEAAAGRRLTNFQPG